VQKEDRRTCSHCPRKFFVTEMCTLDLNKLTRRSEARADDSQNVTEESIQSTWGFVDDQQFGDGLGIWKLGNILSHINIIIS